MVSPQQDLTRSKETTDVFVHARTTEESSELDVADIRVLPFPSPLTTIIQTAYH